jgi:hypothetical protein
MKSLSVSMDCNRWKGAGSAPSASKPAALPLRISCAARGRIYIRVFPHKSISAKPAETRMGKGKGEPEYWAAVVKPGQILYEIGGRARRCGTGMPGTSRSQKCLSSAAS